MKVPTTQQKPVVQLDALACKINASHMVAVEGYKRSLSAALEAGCLLAQAKLAIAHGEWGPWLKKNCPNVPERTASQYMRLHRYSDEVKLAAKSAESADFDISAALGFIRAITTRNEEKQAAKTSKAEKAAKTSSTANGPDIEARLSSFLQTFAWQEVPPEPQDHKAVADKIRELIEKLEGYLGRLAI